MAKATCALILPHNAEIEFTILALLNIFIFFGLRGMDLQKLTIIVNLYILNKHFYDFMVFIWWKYTRGTRFYYVQFDICEDNTIA